MDFYASNQEIETNAGFSATVSNMLGYLKENFSKLAGSGMRASRLQGSLFEGVIFQQGPLVLCYPETDIADPEG